MRWTKHAYERGTSMGKLRGNNSTLPYFHQLALDFIGAGFWLDYIPVA